MEQLQTKQQKRAKFALENLPMTKENKVEHELVQFIIGMPNMILSNGIAQTFAFMLAKSKGDSNDRHAKIFILLKKWLLDKESDFASHFKEVDFSICKNFSDESLAFLKQFNEFDSKTYIDMQDECLKLSEWLKRYARAFDEK